MTHQQILDKLAAKHLVQSIDEDLARLTFYAMCYEKNDIDKQLSYILPKLLNRWNCILNANHNISEIYKQKAVLALNILLHKYGFTDKKIADKALKSIDALNENVVLSDDFFSKSEQIKQYIIAAPTPLKRKPSVPESITFYREKDVISIQLGEHFYGAYIHEIRGLNEAPVLEFYNGVFNKKPTLKELENLPAKGQLYDDKTEHISLFSIAGIKFLPDPANQIQLISACVENKPKNNHLNQSVGLYQMSDIFKIQDTIETFFSSK